MRGRRRGSPDEDRWSRRDWWGVVVDCPDPYALAEFYSALLGWPQRNADPDADDAVLDAGEGVAYLSFQRDPGHVPPQWPAEPGQQRQVLHLDVEVDDLAEAVAHALELGAELAEHQPQDDVRVLLDPAGHPFCLYT